MSPNLLPVSVLTCLITFFFLSVTCVFQPTRHLLFISLICPLLLLSVNFLQSLFGIQLFTMIKFTQIKQSRNWLESNQHFLSSTVSILLTNLQMEDTLRSVLKILRYFSGQLGMFTDWVLLICLLIGYTTSNGGEGWNTVFIQFVVGTFQWLMSSTLEK